MAPSAGNLQARDFIIVTIQDASASIENMLLAAHSMGLGSCWIAAFDEAQVCELLGIPRKTKPVAVIPLGYPGEQPSAPPRMVPDRLVHGEKW